MQRIFSSFHPVKTGENTWNKQIMLKSVHVWNWKDMEKPLRTLQFDCCWCKKNRSDPFRNFQGKGCDYVFVDHPSFRRPIHDKHARNLLETWWNIRFHWMSWKFWMPQSITVQNFGAIEIIEIWESALRGLEGFTTISQTTRTAMDSFGVQKKGERHGDRH